MKSKIYERYCAPVTKEMIEAWGLCHEKHVMLPVNPEAKMFKIDMSLTPIEVFKFNIGKKDE